MKTLILTILVIQLFWLLLVICGIIYGSLNDTLYKKGKINFYASLKRCISSNGLLAIYFYGSLFWLVLSLPIARIILVFTLLEK